MRSRFAVLTICVVLSLGVALAQSGTWTLYPHQATLYSVQVNQPVNADGSSVFKSNGVIPLQFTLSTGIGPVVFESIGSNNPTVTADDYSVLSFSPTLPTLVSQITTLKANYAFATGNCHGGSLRWSVATAAGNLFIYYGSLPNFTDCTTVSQSGLNMIGMSDLRYDTGQFTGGSSYDTYSHAMSLIGNQTVKYVALVIESGWGGDQIVTLTSGTVNDDTWTPSPTGNLAQTCALPPANIKITKTSGFDPGAVDEVSSVQPNDNNLQFRVMNCKYMYNLAANSLSGTGTYKVEALINNVAASGNATFGLK
jgi:hypothetical protein